MPRQPRRQRFFVYIYRAGSKNVRNGTFGYYRLSDAYDRFKQEIMDSYTIGDVEGWSWDSINKVEMLEILSPTEETVLDRWVYRGRPHPMARAWQQGALGYSRMRVGDLGSGDIHPTKGWEYDEDLDFGDDE